MTNYCVKVRPVDRLPYEAYSSDHKQRAIDYATSLANDLDKGTKIYVIDESGDFPVLVWKITK